MHAAATLLISLLLVAVPVVTRAENAPPDGNGLIDADLPAKYRHPQQAAAYEDARDKTRSHSEGTVLRSCPVRVVFSLMRDLPRSGLVMGKRDGRAINDNNNAMKLRAPTLIDIYQLPRLGWDGKFRNIEAVTFAAITSPGNMDLPEHEALARLAGHPGYVVAFKKLFPNEGVSRSTVEQAVAAFERTIVSGPAPFDRWVAGTDRAISESAQRGFALFNGKANCASCHSGWAFTDGSFHDIGTAKGDDIGRGALFPTSRKLRYAFKTPTLRDVAHRAPYMHDGSVPDLPSVIALYNEGGIDRPSRSELIHPLGLSDRDQLDLIAFLNTLTETLTGCQAGLATLIGICYSAYVISTKAET